MFQAAPAETALRADPEVHAHPPLPHVRPELRTIDELDPKRHHYHRSERPLHSSRRSLADAYFALFKQNSAKQCTHQYPTGSSASCDVRHV